MLGYTVFPLFLHIISDIAQKIEDKMFNYSDNLKINQTVQEAGMPATPTSEVIKAEGTNTPRNLFEGSKTPSTRAGKYSIDKEYRKLIVDGYEYKINSFFNIESAINGDFRTLDYIFTYNHLNINDFSVDEGQKV
jgi:hypothetical protein